MLGTEISKNDLWEATTSTISGSFGVDFGIYFFENKEGNVGTVNG